MWRFVMSFLLLTVPLHRLEAQALPTATGPGGYLALGGSVSGFQADYGKRILGGSSIFADANLTWRFGIEGEARRLRYNNESDVTESTFLAGPRWTLRPNGLMPYAKLLVGVGRFDYPYHYAKGQYLVLAPGAGVDWSLGSRITVRLVDFEYQDWPQFTFGELHPYGISAGVSLRLFNGSRYPTYHSWRHLN